jgi:nucleoid-associated protein YgaU
MGNVERILVVVIMATIVVILALAIWGLGQDEVNSPPYGTASGVSPGKEIPVVPGAETTTLLETEEDSLDAEIVVAPNRGGVAPAGPIATVAAIPAGGAESLSRGSSPSFPAGSLSLESPIAGMRRYSVEKGDTYSTIAHKVLGDRNLWKQISDANKDVDPRRLSVGMEILVPARGDAGAPTRVSSPIPAPAPVPPLLASIGGGSGPRTYVTRKGDTLYGIAKRELNDPSKWRSIYEINRSVLPSEKVVPVGLTIALPAGER